MGRLVKKRKYRILNKRDALGVYMFICQQPTDMPLSVSSDFEFEICVNSVIAVILLVVLHVSSFRCNSLGIFLTLSYF